MTTYIPRLSHINGPRLQITFVAHQHHRHLFSILHTFYLFTICSWKEGNLLELVVDRHHRRPHLCPRNFWHCLLQIPTEILHRCAYTERELGFEWNSLCLLRHVLTWSLMAEYSSWPAVSKMSNKHVSPSANKQTNERTWNIWRGFLYFQRWNSRSTIERWWTIK